MKRCMYLFMVIAFMSLVSCGDNGNETDSAAQKFGITGVTLTVGAESSSTKVSRAPLPDGAYVTWETWLENSIWTLPYQPGSFTAWDIQTPATGGDNVTQIVGFAKTCIFTDIDNGSGTTGVYMGYYFGTIDDKKSFFVTTKGTLHLPDGSTYTSEYRQAVEITNEIENYVCYEVYNQIENTFNDRLTFSLSYTIDPSILQ